MKKLVLSLIAAASLGLTACSDNPNVIYSITSDASFQDVPAPVQAAFEAIATVSGTCTITEDAEIATFTFGSVENGGYVMLAPASSDGGWSDILYFQDLPALERYMELTAIQGCRRAFN